MPQHRFEIIFIDNRSVDGTVAVIKALALNDSQVKLIVNACNFGHVRSPYYGLLQAHGDAVILMATDLQDPPELLLEFVKQWEAGFRIAVAVKKRHRGIQTVPRAARQLLPHAHRHFRGPGHRAFHRFWPL